MWVGKGHSQGRPMRMEDNSKHNSGQGTAGNPHEAATQCSEQATCETGRQPLCFRFPDSEDSAHPPSISETGWKTGI